MVLGWNVPVGAGYCSALGQAVSCNYNISTPLQPNYDVVSKAVSFPAEDQNIGYVFHSLS